MKRGKIAVEKITIIRDEDSKRPKVTVEGLWSGKDRRMIYRMLLKEMRKSSNQTKIAIKEADLSEKKQLMIDTIEKKRLEGLKKSRDAKKDKKKEEELENVRGQRKSK